MFLMNPSRGVRVSSTSYDLVLGVITLIPILHIADTVALCCVLVQMAGFEPACLTTPNFNFGLYNPNTSAINLQLRTIRFCLPPSLRCLVLVATLTGRVTCSTFFIFRITEDCQWYFRQLLAYYLKDLLAFNHGLAVKAFGLTYNA